MYHDKKDLQVVECSRLNSVDAGQIEHIWSKIKSAICESMVTIGVTYQLPNISQDDNIKLNQLLECAEEITKNDQLIIAGDFNYPQIRWGLHDANGTTQEAFLDQINR